jgi:hypothetical protein
MINRIFQGWLQMTHQERKYLLEIILIESTLCHTKRGELSSKYFQLLINLGYVRRAIIQEGRGQQHDVRSWINH